MRSLKYPERKKYSWPSKGAQLSKRKPLVGTASCRLSSCHRPRPKSTTELPFVTIQHGDGESPQNVSRRCNVKNPRQRRVIASVNNTVGHLTRHRTALTYIKSNDCAKVMSLFLDTATSFRNCSLVVNDKLRFLDLNMTMR